LIVNSTYITLISDSICAGNSYNFCGKLLTENGIYYDTLQTIFGCDSIMCLTLTTYLFIPIIKNTATICDGDTYNDYYFTNLTQAGIYYDTLSDLSGCDIIFELNLTVNPVYFTQISDSICAGDSYNFFGKLLTESGIYYDTLQTIFGCDSIIELTLRITGGGIIEIMDSELQITGYEIFDVLGRKRHCCRSHLIRYMF